MDGCIARRRVASALFTTAALFAGASALAGEPVRIDITKFAFSPPEITVTIGTTVIWVNHDETPHTIAAGDHAFVSKALDTDDSYAHTFDRDGDVPYFCTVHPFMTGMVHVRK
jgi:plastocyanin